MHKVLPINAPGCFSGWILLVISENIMQLEDLTTSFIISSHYLLH